MIGTVNEYEDDSSLTIASNALCKQQNLNTIVGIKSTSDKNNVQNEFKVKSSNKELVQKPKLTKAIRKDGSRSKSNKRGIKDTFEKVYMQSPLKLLNRRQNNQQK